MKNDTLKNEEQKKDTIKNDMQKNNLSCEVVQDLLPSYMDKLTNTVTNEAVEQHLSRCEKCKEKMQRMQKTDAIVNNEIPTKEIDFLKTLKKKTKTKIILSITAVLVIVALAIGLKIFVIGSEMSPDEVSCDIRITVSDQVEIKDIVCLSSAKYITGISYQEEEGGVLRITFNGVLASPLTAHKKLQTTYQAENDIITVYLGDQIIQDHGWTISRRISDLYLARHEYIGDVSANERSVQALGMREMLGDFESELLTDEEPYGWKITLKSDVHISDLMETEKRMKEYAALLLATIDNLEYITYVYDVETYISGIEPRTMTFTVEDAKDKFGMRFYIPIFDENGDFVESVEEPWDEHDWKPADLEPVIHQIKL